MKKVLFIDYFFPPLEADWRAIAFAKHMPALGWLPVVVSAAESVAYGKDYSTLEGIPSEIAVHRVGHTNYPKSVEIVRRLLRVPYDFPDSYKTWMKPAYHAAKKVIQQEKIDLIYSASPTFTTALVAMRLKQEFGIPWVADFLDGWSVNDFFLEQLDRTMIGPVRTSLLSRIKRSERMILTSADRVVSIHYHVVDRWKEQHGIRGDNITVITDGYEESAFEGLSPRPLSNASLKIVFLGSYYTQFHQTIKDFLQAVYRIDPCAEVFFIGRGLDAVHRLAMPNTVCIMNIPRRKAFEYALSADFLYVAMPPYAHWTPTKTYDYIRLGKPILASVPAEGDAAMHITKAGAGHILPYDPVQLETALRSAFAVRASNRDHAYIAQFDRKHLSSRMADVFNSVISRARTLSRS